MSGLVADVRPLLGPIRDQGRRPTCLAFALSCGHRGSRAFVADFSAEGLHSHAAQSIGQALDQAVPVSAALATLSEPGQVEESAWPYGAAGTATAGAAHYKALGSPFAFDSTKLEAALLSGTPVVAGLEIAADFFHAKTETLVSPASPIQARHAVLIVGLRPGTTGQEYLIRNSWGSRWADAGHAWLHENYLSQTGIFFLTLKGVD
jgi:hypothetical protein